MPRRFSAVSIFLLPLIGLATFSFVARGVTLDQIIKGHGKWSDPTNWTNGQLPTHAEIVTGKGVTLELGDLFSINQLKINGNGIDGAGSLTLTGSGSEWLSGSLTGVNGIGQLVLASTATLEIKAGSKSLLGWSLINHGAISWTGGNITTGTGASITNNGTITTNFDGTLYYNGTPTRTLFTNNLLFSKTGGGGTTEIQATFDNPGTVNVDTGTLLFSGGGQSLGTVAIDSGAKLALDINNYTFGDGAVLNGPGTIEIAGGITTFSGTNGGSAALAVTSGGTAHFSGTTTLSGAVSLVPGGTIDGAGTLVSNGAFNWSGGALDGGGTIDANAGGTLSSTSAKYLYSHTLNLGGTTSWTNGPIYSGGGSTITITPGSEFTTDFDGSLYGNLDGDRATLEIKGTFSKSAGTGATDIQALVENTGTIDVGSGTLLLSGGGKSNANVLIAAGARLLIDTTPFAFESGAELDGPGVIEIGGDATFSGTNGGTAALTISSGGIASISGTTTLSGVVSLQPGGTISGPGTLVSNGEFHWSGGELEGGGILNANSGGTFSSANVKVLSDHTLNLAGTTTWTAGSIYSGGGSTITVKPDAEFITNFDGTLYHNLDGDRATLEIKGTFSKSAGTGATDIQALVENTGTIDVDSGALLLAGGGESSAKVSIHSDARLVIDSNPFTFEAGAELEGPGTIEIAGGITTFSGSNGGTAALAITPGGTALISGTTTLSGAVSLEAGGIIDGAGTLHSNGAFNWTGGDLKGGGLLNANAGGVLSANTKHLYSHTLVLDGNTSWTGGAIYSGGGSLITNKSGKTFSTNFDGAINHNLVGAKTTFANEGVFNKTGGTGTTYLDAVFNNTGTVNANTGKIQLAGGGTNSAGAKLLAADDAEIVISNDYTLADGSLLIGPGIVRFTHGILTVIGSSTFGNFVFDGGQLAGTNSFNGDITWRGGNWSTTALGPSTTIEEDATLTLANSSTHDFDYRALINHGTVTWEGNYFRSGHGGSFTNAANAAFNDLTSSGTHYIYSDSDTAFTFTNHGTYNKTGSSTTEIRARFDNHHEVKVSSGTLRLQGGGANASTGTFATSLGAVTEFNDDYTISNGSSLTGAGTYWLSAGTLTINGNIAVSTFDQTNGKLAGSQNFTSGTVNWSSGSWDATELGPTTTIGSNATLNFLANNTHDFNFRAITNEGTANWHGHYIRSGHGGSFTNATNAKFNDLTSGGTQYIYSDSDTAFTFTNHGTYNKTGNSTTEIWARFDNHHEVKVYAGTLRLNGGGTNASTGTFATSLGAVTEFNDDYTISNGSSLTGAGTYWLSAGTLTINGNIAVSTFDQTNGKLAGSQNFTSGTVNWSSGNWDATELGPTTTIGSNATLNFLANNTHDFNFRAITNEGTANWHGHYIRSGHGGSFTNATNAAFNDLTSSGTQYIYSDSNTAFTFTNHGTYNKTGNSTTEIRALFTNHGEVAVSNGTLRFTNAFTQNAGKLVVANGATVSFDEGLAFDFGTLTGTGTIVGDVSNAALLSPGNSAGTLNITGDLSLVGASVALFELGGTSRGSSYDAVNVTETANLGGSLRLVFTNDFHTTVLPTDTFTLFSAGSLSGAFSNVPNGARLFTFDGLGSFQVNYGAASALGATFANSVILTDFVPVPEPSTWALLLGGLGVLSTLLYRRRRR